MHIRLVRSLDVDISVIEAVSTVLRTSPGPAVFSTESNTIALDAKDLSWEDFFSSLRRYRKQFGVPADDYMVLLTSKPNTNNWFSAFDSRNIFVHTAGWEYYVACQPQYAIAYEVVDNIYQSLAFKSIEAVVQFAHDPPAGCINDMCTWKPDISLKFRTADICEGCLELSHQADLPQGFLKQMLSIFEEVRVHSLYSAPIRPLISPDNSLPFPVAFTKRKLSMTTEPLRKFLVLIDHFDSLLRTSTLMLGRIFLGKGFERFAEKQGLSGTPSLGHWVAALQALGRETTTQPSLGVSLPPDLRERLDLIVQRATDDKVVQLRNEKRGHGYCDCNDQTYREVFESCLPAVQYADGVLSPLLKSFEMVYIEIAEYISDDEAEICVRKLMGDHPDFLEERITLRREDLKELPIRRRVYARSRDKRHWHDLHPFIVYDHCPVCKHSRVLISDGEQYLDPYAGHRVRLTP